MSALVKGLTVGEVVKFELPLNYNRESITLKQNQNATADLEIGTVLKYASGWEPVVSGSESSAAAILLEKVSKESLAAVGGVKALALVRGPAIVDKDNLSVKVVAVVAALEALGIICRAEPTKQSVGL
ncbi:MAG TPA: head decoration protein [Anaerohalosphaeraceae bacterium]|nr:head decoration protein [Anaerohalosphaeraceae bacterium]